VLNNPLSMPACSEALLSDQVYGALVVPQTLVFDMYKTRLQSLALQSERHGKIACSVLISNWLQGPGTWEAESNANIALFRSMDRCFRTIAAWHRRADIQSRGERKLQRVSAAGAGPAAARLIAAAPNDRLSESESKAVLELYGIPTVREICARSPQELQAAAAALGFPLALKVNSADIAHKTDAGGVALNLRSVEELGAAFERVLANARSCAPQAKIDGVLLQPMVPAGVEVVVGARIDPLLGPLVLAGFGGTLVELLRDTALELAPINAEEAERLLRKLKGAALLDGFRGAPALDGARLADILVRVSEFAADLQQHVAELDINPIICNASTLIAVDALIVRA
jgi:acyl-CoA synthetase (NDP forming)